MDWIPISEREPPEWASVIIYVPPTDDNPGGVMAAGVSKDLDIPEKTTYESEEGFDLGQPTHWMPLPDPPK